MLSSPPSPLFSFSVSAHHPRSYSASPPEGSSPDVTSRHGAIPICARRPASPVLSDTPTSKWDVEQWRRGNTKRARDWETHVRSYFHRYLSEGSTVNSHSYIALFQAAMQGHNPLDAPICAGNRARTTLPSSSAAFHFSQRTRKSEPRNARRASLRTAPEMAYHSAPVALSEDLTRMRTDALSDLHRLVAETGEGMVSRMRDWERARTCTERDMDEDEEMEGPRKRKPRTMSMSDVEIDMEVAQPSFLGGSPPSSASDTWETDTDEEDDIEFSLHSSPSISSSFASIGTPALSHTLGTSANSSLASLPLPPSITAHAGTEFTGLEAPSAEPFRGATPRPRLVHLSSSSSRSEKAIAALTLALANGAGGVNDYQDLLQLDPQAVMEESQVGDMW